MLAVRLMPTCKGRRPRLELQPLIIQLNRDRETEFLALLLGIGLESIGTDARHLPSNTEISGGEGVDADVGIHAGIALLRQPGGTCTKPILLLGTSTFASSEPIGTTFITVWVDWP